MEVNIKVTLGTVLCVVETDTHSAYVFRTAPKYYSGARNWGIKVWEHGNHGPVVQRECTRWGSREAAITAVIKLILRRLA